MPVASPVLVSCLGVAAFQHASGDVYGLVVRRYHPGCINAMETKARDTLEIEGEVVQHVTSAFTGRLGSFRLVPAANQPLRI